MEMRAVFPQQTREPVAHENPKPVTPPGSLSTNEPAKLRIMRIDGIGACDQFANPAVRQRCIQPDADFLPNPSRDGCGDEHGINVYSRDPFHGSVTGCLRRF